MHSENTFNLNNSNSQNIVSVADLKNDILLEFISRLEADLNSKRTRIQESLENIRNVKSELTNEQIVSHKTGSKSKRKLSWSLDNDNVNDNGYKMKLNRMNENFPMLSESFSICNDWSVMTNKLRAATKIYTPRELFSFRNGESLATGSKIISSIESSPSGNHFATAGVLKSISFFELPSNIDESIMSFRKYPILDIKCNSKISCLSWNKSDCNRLYSADYDGVLNLYDSNTGALCTSWTEHEKRCWTVDSSALDPFKILTGSDDCKVKLWTNQSSKSVMTIDFRANVCSVKFSPSDSNLIAIGAADHRVFLIDLRKPSVPILNEKRHLKSVSYIKFMENGKSLVSSSTDSTLRQWAVGQGYIWEPVQTYSGHLNEKNFVGLAISSSDLIATGSEDNSIVLYDKYLEYPVLKYQLNTCCPLTGNPMSDELGTFVSSVTWSNRLDCHGNPILLAANSSGNVKALSINIID